MWRAIKQVLADYPGSRRMLWCELAVFLGFWATAFAAAIMFL